MPSVEHKCQGVVVCMHSQAPAIKVVFDMADGR